ncbi:hypothetical protein FEM48_Zijuj03G0164500 [Ziziphus jujuba var. spinosa]|uniref:WRKY domain-containing protein n=1 Tax=Ziziphus jujuba var. spinosa TaxID=714518 RepID=A0A978VRD6_ZIZJJ|nr:hypothetical protein FEM48_Zijuj03G0164500 [Ziziphus jujuba var. spinosa]
MAEDWDLYAVVRSCKSATHTATATAAAAADDDNIYPISSSTSATCATEGEEEDPLACLASLKFEENDDPFSFPNLLVEPRNNAFQELQQFYEPFFSNHTTTTTTTTTSTNNLGVVIPDSSISEFGGKTSGQQQKQQHHHHDNNNLLNISANIRPRFSPASYISGFGGFSGDKQVKHAQAQPKQEQQNIEQEARDQQGLIIQRPETSSAAATSCLSIGQSQTQTPRSRKRKSQQKRMVCHVTQENLSGDLWAWRKYGQKPIKGSPYPRNYYRCSSSKGCAARKQVERSNTDPNMFIVTYTGEHTHPRPTHRNSLAGSTRTKFTANQKQTTDKDTDQPSSTMAANNPSCSSPLSGTSLSPPTPLTVQTDEETAKLQAEDKLSKESEEIMDDENEDIEIEDDILIPNMVMSEDIFLGLQELGCISSSPPGTATAADQIQSPSNSRDSFSEKGPSSLGSYWASSSSAAAGATVGGGC